MLCGGVWLWCVRAVLCCAVLCCLRRRAASSLNSTKNQHPPTKRINNNNHNITSGKTTLAMHAIAEVQRLGGNCAFVDAEHAFDAEYARVSRRCGAF